MPGSYRLRSNLLQYNVRVHVWVTGTCIAADSTLGGRSRACFPGIAHIQPLNAPCTKPCPQFLFGAPVALIKRHRRQRMEQILALVELYSPFPTRRFTGLSPLSGRGVVYA